MVDTCVVCPVGVFKHTSSSCLIVGDVEKRKFSGEDFLSDICSIPSDRGIWCNLISVHELIDFVLKYRVVRAQRSRLDFHERMVSILYFTLTSGRTSPSNNFECQNEKGPEVHHLCPVSRIKVDANHW